MNNLDNKAISMARQCRNCRHRPRSWLRWETPKEIYHDGMCLAAKQITRPDRRCDRWDGWGEQAELLDCSKSKLRDAACFAVEEREGDNGE